MISVIISTKNRANFIEPCLKSIEESFQYAGYEDAEIIVVDNGSTDHTAEVIKEIAKTSAIKIVYVLETKIGLSAARNAGIRTSSGQYLIFTDDDCQLSKEYIKESIAYMNKDTQLILRSGPVKLGNPEDLPITIKDVKEVKTWKKPEDARKEGHILGSSLIGCNMAGSRKTIEAIGYFDELLGAGTLCKASEDTDYYYRAYLKGVTLEIVTDLILYHHHGRRTQEQKDSLHKNYAIGNGALVMKYLFIYPSFSKHFWWDLKALFEHRILGKPSKTKDQMPIEKKVLCELMGAIYYIKSLLKHALTSKNK